MVSTSIQVRYRHGNTAKTSNSAKIGTQKEFLQFVDLKLTAKWTVCRFLLPHVVLYSVVFNTSNAEEDVAHYEEQLASEWLESSTNLNLRRVERKYLMVLLTTGLNLTDLKYRFALTRKITVTLAQNTKAEITGKQTTINRQKQSTSASPEEMKKLEDDLASLKQQLENHRSKASQSHEYYIEVTKQVKRVDFISHSWPYKEIISDYAEVIIDEGEIVYGWRTPLSKKFRKLITARFHLHHKPCNIRDSSKVS